MNKYPISIRMRFFDQFVGRFIYDVQMPYNPEKAAKGEYSKLARMYINELPKINDMGIRKPKLKLSFMEMQVS